MSEISYIKECSTRDLALKLVEDYKITLPEALNILYNSETFQKMQDDSTGLYHQSPVYIYDYLKQELTKGKLSD